jgi:hypothetical protein
MTTAKPSQFSLTVWPGGIVEPGGMWPPHSDSQLLGGGWIDLRSGHEDLVHGLVPAPEEMYLRLARDTDLSDPEALLDVVRKVGGFRSGGPQREFGSDEAYEHGWRRSAVHRGLPYGDPPRPGALHVGEVAWRLRVLDVCGRVVVAYRNGDHVAPAWMEQMLPEPRKELVKMSKPMREQRVWTDWLNFMNPALRRWHVRPVISGLPFGTLDEWWPTILEVGALQIINDLVREADYHVCANETCGRLFARQVGDSEVFSRRTGVRFCSPSCRNAQQQREHRRRVKVRKEGRSS